MTRRDAAAAALACAAAIAMASAMWSASAGFARLRWVALAHDRNAHYVDALELAIDARAGDAASFVRELDRSRQWPPLPPLLAGGAMLVGGVDPRVATLPSLAAWTGMAVLAGFAAHAAAPSAPIAAGAIALALALGSPAHRAFATDVMSESLGAFGTLLALVAWSRARGGGGIGAWRLLGAAGTLLFFTKYNYWLLAALALAAADALYAPQSARTALRAASTRGVPWLARQLRRPFVWIVPAALVWAALQARLGPWRGEWLGVPIEVRGAAEPLHVAFVAAVLACVPWWRRHGRAWLAAIDPRARALLLWHALPLGLYFLLPARLGRVLAYVGPGNSQTEWSNPLVGARRYAAWIASDGFATPLAAAGALALALLALPALRRRTPGALGAALLLGVGGALAVLHPNHQPRYAHTFTPALWVLAGAGGAALVSLARGASSRTAIAACLVAAFALAARDVPLAGRSERSGTHAPGTSFRDVTDAALDLAAGAPRLAFVATAPMDKSAKWSVFERRPKRAAFAGFYHPEDRSDVARAGFARWIAAIDADAVVLVEGLAQSPFATVEPPPSWREIGMWMRSQSRFALASERELPAYGVTVSVWREASRP